MQGTDWIGVGNIIAQLLVAGVAIWAVIASLRATKKQIEASDRATATQIAASDRATTTQIAASEKQLKEQLVASALQVHTQVEASEKQLKEQLAASDLQVHTQIEESRRLATEERQHQSRPIIAPEGTIIQTTATSLNIHTGESTGERMYTSEKRINWSYGSPIKIGLHNMGNGPAFNIHMSLYGSEDVTQSQFISWDNGPLEEKGTIKVALEHSSALRLFHSDSVNGTHPLYDKSGDSPDNPWMYRIACLTITYHDLFRKKYVSIFHYTLEHQWVHIASEEIAGLGLDLKELNVHKQQQGPKYAAPPARTA